MSFKTGGTKTKFIPQQYSGGPSDSYTVYAALESCSDIMCYVMVDDKNGDMVNISYGTEDDCAHGVNSLIDVMYYLKHHDVGRYSITGHEMEDIVIEEMTDEEIRRYFKSDTFDKPRKVKL